MIENPVGNWTLTLGPIPAYMQARPDLRIGIQFPKWLRVTAECVEERWPAVGFSVRLPHSELHDKIFDIFYGPVAGHATITYARLVEVKKSSGQRH